MVECGLRGGAVVGGVAYVVGQPLLGADLERGVGGRRAVEVGEHDLVAEADQPLRDGAADAARPSGDHDAGVHGH